MADRKLAKHLGYANTATLWKARRGRAFIDLYRLQRLAELRVDGMRPNIDWLVTGQGNPLTPLKAIEGEQSRMMRALHALTSEERAALLVLAKGRRRSKR